jgi:excisionase family DNA binding protein
MAAKRNKGENMDKLLLRIPEAAQMISVGRSTMYELVASGVVPSVRFGKSVRVPAQALEEWIRKKYEQANCELV